MQTLVSPPPHSTLILSLAVSYSAIRLVLVYKEGKKHLYVYFTSKTLQSTEERYQVIDKLILALVFSALRLRHYIKSFNITIRIDYPIKQVLQMPELIVLPFQAFQLPSVLPFQSLQLPFHL